MKAIIFILLSAAFINTSCTKSTGAETEINTKDPAMGAETATVNKALVLQLVNDVRKKGCQCGDTYYGPAPAVSWNDQLEQAAYNHSKDMYQNNFFSHSASDGSDTGQRTSRTGYSWKAYGENIGNGYPSEKEMVAGWISSPGHCKNLMGKQFKEMGVARVGPYWTQVLAAK